MKKKWVPRTFRYTQCDTLLTYLEEMERKGWRFRRFRFGLLFEACEASDPGEGEAGTAGKSDRTGLPARYDVQVFLKNKEEDLAPGEETLDFAAYCEAAGWELVDSRRRFVVFRRIRDEAVPILTEEERLEGVLAAQRWVTLPSLVASLLLFLLLFVGNDCLLNLRVFHSVGNLFDPIFLSLRILTLALLADSVLETIHLLLWRREKMRELAAGGCFACREKRAARVLLAAGWILVLACGLYALFALFSDLVQAHAPLSTKVLLFFPYLMIWGVSALNTWGQPSRETRDGRLALAVLAVLFIGWFAGMCRNVYGTDREDSAVRNLENMNPPVKITDLLTFPDDRDTDLTYGDRAQNPLGSWSVYSYSCGTPGFDQVLRAWEEGSVGKSEEEIGEEPADSGLALLEYEIAEIKNRTLAAALYRGLTASYPINEQDLPEEPDTANTAPAARASAQEADAANDSPAANAAAQDTDTANAASAANASTKAWGATRAIRIKENDGSYLWYVLYEGPDRAENILLKVENSWDLDADQIRTFSARLQSVYFQVSQRKALRHV